jgi:hypothetical protein
MVLSLFRLFGWFDRNWLTDPFFVTVAHGGHKLTTAVISKLWIAQVLSVSA